MTLSEKTDLVILFVLIVWAGMDRCNLYFREKP